MTRDVDAYMQDLCDPFFFSVIKCWLDLFLPLPLTISTIIYMYIYII